MNPAFPGKGASRPPDVVVERREYHSHCDCARLETRIKSLENDNGAIGCMSFLLLMLLFGVVSLFHGNQNFHSNVIKAIHRVLEIQDSVEK